MKLDLLSLIKAGLNKVVSQTSRAPQGPTFDRALTLAKREGPPSVAASNHNLKDSPPAQKPAVSFAARYSSPHIEMHDKLKLAVGAHKLDDSNIPPKPVEGKGRSKNTSFESMPLVASVPTTVVPTQVTKPIIAAAQNVTVEKVATSTRTETVGNSPDVAPTAFAALSQAERRSEMKVDLPKAGNQTRAQNAVPTPNVENSIPGVEWRTDREQARNRLNPRGVADRVSHPDTKQATATAHRLNDVSEKSAQVRTSEQVTTVSSKHSDPVFDKIAQNSNQNQKTEQKQTASLVDMAGAKQTQMNQHEGVSVPSSHVMQQSALKDLITERPSHVMQQPAQKELVEKATPKQKDRVKSDSPDSRVETTPHLEREAVPQKTTFGQIVHEKRMPIQVVQSRQTNVQADRSEVVARVWEVPKELAQQQVVTRFASSLQSLDATAPEQVVQAITKSKSETKRPVEFARTVANSREVPNAKNLATPEVKANGIVKAQSGELPRKPELPRKQVFVEPQVIVERDVLQKPVVPGATSPATFQSSHNVKRDSAPPISHEVIGKPFTTDHEMPHETMSKSPAQLQDAKPASPERGAQSVVKNIVKGSVPVLSAEPMHNDKTVEKAMPVVHARAHVNEIPIKQTTSQVVASARHSDHGINRETKKSAAPLVPKPVLVTQSRPLTEEAIGPKPKRVETEQVKPAIREIINELRAVDPTAPVEKTVRSEPVVITQKSANEFDVKAPQSKDASISVALNGMIQHEAPAAKELPVVERKANEQSAQFAPEKAPETVMKREQAITPNPGGKGMPLFEPFIRALPTVIPFTPILEPRTGSVATNSFDGSRKEQAKIERINNDLGERLSERSENSNSGKSTELKSIDNSNTTRQESNSQSGDREAGNSAARAALEKVPVNQATATATATAKSAVFTSSAANESLKLALQQALEQSRRRLVEPDELRLTLQFGEMGTLDIDVLRESDKFSIRIAADPAMAAMMEEQRLQLVAWLKEQGFPIQQLEIAERHGGQVRREGMASENSAGERDSGERGSSGGGSNGGFGHDESSESGPPRPAYSGARVWTA